MATLVRSITVAARKRFVFSVRSQNTKGCFRIAVVLSLACAGHAQTRAPEFRADRVLLSNSTRPAPLARGMLISIYGTNLGPEQGCVAETVASLTELCGVQVYVGDVTAGLLYVQDKQINFTVPEVTLGGTAELKVVYRGRSNQPVSVPVGSGRVELSVEGTARVGGPIWIKIDMPFGSGEVHYPVSIAPADFGCNEIEVRQNGVLLPRIAMRSVPMVRNGPPCGNILVPGRAPRHTGRLPLHLQYRFEKPGIYEVRYALNRPRFETNGDDAALQSAWTRIEVFPAQAQPRKNPPADPAEVLGDYLPGILGFADAAGLQIVLGYLYDPNEIVRRYAQTGLAYWPQQEIDARVAELVRTKGPSDVLVNLIRVPTAELTESMLADLASDNRILLQGAILGMSKALSDPTQALPAAVRARAENGLLGAVEHVVRTGNPEMLNNLAVALGSVHDDRARDVLWGFHQRKVAAEQSLIAISWHKDPRDLPRLGALLVAPVAGDPMDRELASIPYALRNSYGDAAVTFLETGVKDSGYVWVRTNCARELIIAGKAAGFAFIVDAIENNRFYKREMIEFVRERFPELKGADEAAVLQLVKARAF
jgi:hypothetical protein